MVNRRIGQRLAAMLAAAVLASACGYAEENTDAGETADGNGFQEIEALLNIRDVGELDGMDLEEVTALLEKESFAQFYDGDSGFSLLYPDIFLFQDMTEEAVARTEDGSATLTISSTERNGMLSEKDLSDAIRLEHPDGRMRRYEMNGCLRVDSENAETGTASVNLFLMTDSWVHHICMTFLHEKQEQMLPYIEYMIYSMTSEETDAG